MLCLIVAYKSHRQDQRLESFVWGRPFVTTSVKIAGAQHRHLRRGAAVSATTGRVGSGSLSNGSCARICGNQSHNPQKPTAKEYGKQTTCKQPWTNQRCILHIDWMSLSFRMLALPLRRFVSLRGSKFTSWKTQRVWRIHLPRLRWLALCWLLAQWPVPVTCETGIALGFLTLMPSTQAATQQKEAKFVRIGYTKNLPGTCQPNSINLASNEANHASIRMPASSYAVLNLVWYFWQWFQLCIHWTHLWPLKPASLMLMTAPCKDRHPVRWNLLKSRLPSTP